MLLSWRWLNEFVDLKGRTIESVAERLTMTGCEVESIETPCELLSGIKIARIEKLYPHPEADTLKVAEIISSEGSHTCITAAPNLSVGDKVPYAPPGACLADGAVMGQKDFLGITSEGMLLSAEEIGLPDIADEFGILRLPDDTPLQADLKGYFGLDDRIMDISITPNRGDLLSVMGLAREVHALFPDSTLLDIREWPGGLQDNWPCDFEDIKIIDQGCTFYSLGLAENIKIGPSPLRERIRVNMMGMRPISNVVDATNLVMLLTGQPLHAFDLDLIPQRSIEVRSALEGEIFTTLDNKEHVLQEGDLLITSGDVPVGIAGVMGGQNSEIHEGTQKVVIESAHFSAPRVSQTSRRLGINSEAAYRFARGVDPEKVIPSLEYVLMLLEKWCGSRIYAQKKIARSHVPANRKITLRSSTLRKVLLWDDLHETSRILHRLGLVEIDRTLSDLTVEVPSWRPDLSIEEDLTEEVGRIRGYDLIKPRLPGKLHGGGTEGPLYHTQRVIREVALGRGFTEVVTYSFISKDFISELNISDEDPRSHPVLLSNPISQQMVCMRTLMLPGLLNSLKNSIKSGWREEIKIFEMGRVFLLKDTDNLESLEEPERVAGLVFPGQERRVPYRQTLEEDFYSVKGDISALIRSRGFNPGFGKGEEPFGHSGQTASVYINDERRGLLLRLKPSIEAQLEVEGPVFYFEIDLAPLMNPRKPEYRDISSYPAVYRDISLLVNKETEAEKVKQYIAELAGDLLCKLKLFDIYQGKGIPEEQRSLAFSLAYRRDDRTLKDAEVDQVHEQVRAGLEKKGFALR